MNATTDLKVFTVGFFVRWDHTPISAPDGDLIGLVRVTTTDSLKAIERARRAWSEDEMGGGLPPQTARVVRVQHIYDGAVVEARHCD